MPRVLVLTSTTSYRTDDFVAAAGALGVEAVIGSDRCHVLDGVYRYPEGTLALDLRDPRHAAAQVVAAARDRPLDAIVPTSDLTAVVAALAGAELGLPHNPPDAAAVAANKRRMREALAAAGMRTPRFRVFPVDADPAVIAAEVGRDVGWPCVVKPLLLSASRGVIRADDARTLAAAVLRVHALLSTPELAAAAARDPDGARLLVESFVPGAEVAVEALLSRGALVPLAIFDKPDPLDGPYFEETIYVTPSRHPAEAQRALVEETRRAARAIGLVEGPVHAELRLGPAGPVAIEVAARPIGGLCSRTLRFTLAGGARSLEELVVAHALGRPTDDAARERPAAGVMMLPIPAAGVLAAVEGEEAARAMPLVTDLAITVRPGEKLVPLPEGAAYLGFLFARGDTPAAVEEALRAAHARLRFRVTPLL